jgi:hypothetical protein
MLGSVADAVDKEEGEGKDLIVSSLFVSRSSL